MEPSLKLFYQVCRTHVCFSVCLKIGFSVVYRYHNYVMFNGVRLRQCHCLFNAELNLFPVVSCAVSVCMAMCMCWCMCTYVYLCLGVCLCVINRVIRSVGCGIILRKFGIFGRI